MTSTATPPPETDPADGAPEPTSPPPAEPVRLRRWPGVLAALSLPLLTLACTLGYLAWDAGQRGPRIVVVFPEGHGLKAGDALKHRGVVVGQVRDVGLTGDLDRVRVEIELTPTAAGLAREGSRFWILRPQLSLTRISGLDTIVGARYVEVTPGPAGGAPRSEFTGLERPATQVVREQASRRIRIRFRDGRGLSAGAPLRYRGIEVGEVTSVALDPSDDRVVVGAQLAESAGHLARAGTQFWVERPEVTLAGGVQGLERALRSSVGILPGARDAPPCLTFEGREDVPVLTEREPGALDIVLECADRKGLERGTPLLYRGGPIGRIVSLGLASDSRTILARAVVGAAYRPLVRDNSRFWKVRALEFDFGLLRMQQLRFDISSLNTVLRGGVVLGTPSPPGARVTTGHRFGVADAPEPAWPNWSPQIAMGPGAAGPRPRLLWAVQSWSAAIWGGLRTGAAEAAGWVLPVAGGRLLGPATLLGPRAEAKPPGTRLAVGGHERVLTGDGLQTFGALALRAADPKARLAGPSWPANRLRVPVDPEDCVVLGAEEREPLPLDRGRLAADEAGWRVDAAVAFDAAWHGAAVLSRRDGQLIGILAVSEGRGIVHPLTPALVAALGSPK